MMICRVVVDDEREDDSASERVVGGGGEGVMREYRSEDYTWSRKQRPSLRSLGSRLPLFVESSSSYSFRLLHHSSLVASLFCRWHVYKFIFSEAGPILEAFSLREIQIYNYTRKVVKGYCTY